MSGYLLISASPRSGNTQFVLNEIYKKLSGEKELISLKDKKIKHCRGCLSCHEKPECVIKDDMEGIRKKVLDSGVLIIGTPNYFGNVSGLMKDFIDRCHPFYKKELLKDKKVFFVFIGGGEKEDTREYMKNSISGFLKYLKLDSIGFYTFKALKNDELRKNNIESDIKRIVKEI